MTKIYGDLHIHIGRTSQGKPVKITASPKLKLENIPKVAKEKGLELLGIVDAACSGVLIDLKEYLNNKTMTPLAGGGYFWNGLILFLGHEIELVHSTGREAHFIAYFPTIENLVAYQRAILPWLTNPSLSTQRLKTNPDTWLNLVLENKGVAIAAHAFTPHKGVYGNCVRKLSEMFFQPEKISALELGLSANTAMAMQTRDSHSYAYIANSDAHSLSTMGREFTIYNLRKPNFEEWKKGLAKCGQGIVATHGMDPLLGKYYRSFCPHCRILADEERAVLECPRCKKAMITGVWDRLMEIRDFTGLTDSRPPYKKHVPLIMLSGVGSATYTKLIAQLGTEIEIMYTVSLESIASIGGENLARQIKNLRLGKLLISPGGGGKYGRVKKIES